MNNSFFLFKDIARIRTEKEEENMDDSVHLSKKRDRSTIEMYRYNY